jgi:trk system potassium uptake protein
MKFCVIGLGRFGYQLAVTLAENGMEVMAIDSNESIVASIRDHVTQAICMRVHDETGLRSIGVDEMETVIVAMGENFAQSILITALLKKRLKIKQVIARAINDIHQEILELIGADRTILPEIEIGIRFADKLSSPFTDLLRLTPEFSISQLRVPEKFLGQTVQDLDLFANYKVQVIGVKQEGKIIPVEPSYIIEENDRLILSGTTEGLEAVAKL